MGVRADASNPLLSPHPPPTPHPPATPQPPPSHPPATPQPPPSHPSPSHDPLPRRSNRLQLQRLRGFVGAAQHRGASEVEAGVCVCALRCLGVLNGKPTKPFVCLDWFGLVLPKSMENTQKQRMRLSIASGFRLGAQKTRCNWPMISEFQAARFLHGSFGAIPLKCLVLVGEPGVLGLMASSRALQQIQQIEHGLTEPSHKRWGSPMCAENSTGR